MPVSSGRVFARDLEARGRARATVTRRLCTIAGFYTCAVERRLETWCTPITGYGEYEGLSGGTTVLRLSMT
jgi:hypothetical protein